MTSTSLEEVNRKANKSYNTEGNPIKLPSKLLAVIPDPVSENGIYVAESAGTIKRVDLSSREVSHTFVGPLAPVSCIEILAQRSSDGTIHQTLFGGCWDKNVWSWDIPDAANKSTSTIKSNRQYRGHTDFVKAVVTLPLPGTSNALLITGGAESEIIFWDITSGARLHILKGHLRGILDLKFDPTTTYQGSETAILYSACSDREIRTCSIPIPSSSNTHNPGVASIDFKSLRLSSPLNVHETSVYALYFDPDGSGLWTASADKTAKHLSRTSEADYLDQPTPSNIPPPESSWEVDTTLPHPDFVRAVTTSPSSGLVLTACRDEEVRVWNIATGKLEHVYTGHYEEVTGLCVRGEKVVSVSIDGTIREWGIGKADIETAKKEAERIRLAGGNVEDEEATIKDTGESMLTEEEERELAELMAEE